jgi:hypothetical protein
MQLGQRCRLIILRSKCKLHGLLKLPGARKLVVVKGGCVMRPFSGCSNQFWFYVVNFMAGSTYLNSFAFVEICSKKFNC